MFNKQHYIIKRTLVNYCGIVGAVEGASFPEISGKF